MRVKWLSHIWFIPSSVVIRPANIIESDEFCMILVLIRFWFEENLRDEQYAQVLLIA